LSNEAQILLKEIQFKTGKTLEDIAKDIGYSRPYLNNVKLKGAGEKVIGLLKEKYKGILQNVSYEINEDPAPYYKKRQEIKSGSKKAIPFYDAPAAAGVTETEMTAISSPAGTIDIGDLLSDSQAAIRIYGNSMLPNYPPGCVVGLAKVSDTFIEPGEVYVIETRDRRILKRLFYKDDETEGDKLLCYSDNIMKFEGGSRHGKPAYPPFAVPKADIINIFVVTGVIKRNANSVIINR
jgi:hypothetical protein